jgi:hypothetical protein
MIRARVLVADARAAAAPTGNQQIIAGAWGPLSFIAVAWSLCVCWHLFSTDSASVRLPLIHVHTCITAS